MGQVNTELGLSATATITLNDAAVRTLFGIASGTIDMNSGHGKANTFQFTQTITTNTANYNIRASAVAAGWDQVKPLAATITINSGVYLYSTSTSTPALATGVTFPAGSTFLVINNGAIYGKAGAGAAANSTNGCGAPATGFAGGAAGPAVSINSNISITNNANISGGGGGGGGGGGAASQFGIAYASGGPGGNGRDQNAATAGGAGPACRGFYDTEVPCMGAYGHYAYPGSGGTGGGWGAAGAAGNSGNGDSCSSPGGAGGAAGKCVALNGFTVTWNVIGTRNGAVS